MNEATKNEATKSQAALSEGMKDADVAGDNDPSAHVGDVPGDDAFFEGVEEGAEENAEVGDVAGELSTTADEALANVSRSTVLERDDSIDRSIDEIRPATLQPLDMAMVRPILEGAILAAGEALSIDRMLLLFDDEEGLDKAFLRDTLQNIQADCDGRGFELVEVASGWRFQVRTTYAPWVNRLWDEKPQKYSRALLETLALIAYRQPLTRGDIEEVRGVAVSSHIIKTLVEREWVKVVGHRDVPGRPALYATTRQFLDYFSLKSLDELPSLGELKDIDSLNRDLELEAPVSESNEGDVDSPDAAVDGALDTEPRDPNEVSLAEAMAEEEGHGELNRDENSDSVSVDPHDATNNANIDAPELANAAMDDGSEPTLVPDEETATDDTDVDKVAPGVDETDADEIDADETDASVPKEPECRHQTAAIDRPAENENVTSASASSDENDDHSDYSGGSLFSSPDH